MLQPPAWTRHISRQSRQPVIRPETQNSAARAGNGIGRLLSYQIHKDLQQDTLIEILSDFRSQPIPAQLVAQNVKYMPTKVRTFWHLARTSLPELGSLR